MLSNQESKEIVKEALKEWLDEKFATFGRWSFYSLASAGFVALVYFTLMTHGWKPPT